MENLFTDEAVNSITGNQFVSILVPSQYVPIEGTEFNVCELSPESSRITKCGVPGYVSWSTSSALSNLSDLKLFNKCKHLDVKGIIFSFDSGAIVCKYENEGHNDATLLRFRVFPSINDDGLQHDSKFYFEINVSGSHFCHYREPRSRFSPLCYDHFPSDKYLHDNLSSQWHEGRFAMEFHSFKMPAHDYILFISMIRTAMIPSSRGFIPAYSLKWIIQFCVYLIDFVHEDGFEGSSPYNSIKLKEIILFLCNPDFLCYIFNQDLSDGVNDLATVPITARSDPNLLFSHHYILKSVVMRIRHLHALCSIEENFNWLITCSDHFHRLLNKRDLNFCSSGYVKPDVIRFDITDVLSRYPGLILYTPDTPIPLLESRPVGGETEAVPLAEAVMLEGTTTPPPSIGSRNGQHPPNVGNTIFNILSPAGNTDRPLVTSRGENAVTKIGFTNLKRQATLMFIREANRHVSQLDLGDNMMMLYPCYDKLKYQLSDDVADLVQQRIESGGKRTTFDKVTDVLIDEDTECKLYMFDISIGDYRYSMKIDCPRINDDKVVNFTVVERNYGLTPVCKVNPYLNNNYRNTTNCLDIMQTVRSHLSKDVHAEAHNDISVCRALIEITQIYMKIFINHCMFRDGIINENVIDRMNFNHGD